jgi:hypothetical protein
LELASVDHGWVASGGFHLDPNDDRKNANDDGGRWRLSDALARVHHRHPTQRRVLAVTNAPNALWSTGTDEAGVAIGYMCLIDWQHHVGADAFGWKVYPSKNALVAVHPTAETSCGIIEIEMRGRRIVVEQDLRGEETTA